MTPQRLPDSDILARYEAYRKFGNYVDAAEELGINESNVRRAVREATRRNLTGEALGGPMPEGYTLGRITRLASPAGTQLEWQHMNPDVEAVENTIEALIEGMAQSITPLQTIAPYTMTRNTEQLTLYPVVDVHLGQFSWGKETGENYDLKIAREQFLRTTRELVGLAPYSGTALIAILGDFFHADNNDATTHKSHNHLDVDGRIDKVLHLGVELCIWHIDLALQKHLDVIVHVSRGNHDPHLSKALATALYFRYQDNPRVSIDRSPMDLWSMQWGVNMLSFTHGDMIKAEQMPGKMAAFEPQMWGNTTERYGFSGHFHRQKKGPLSDEADGATWEILPAFTAKDAWNKAMGFSGKREMQAITFDLNEGRKFTQHARVK